MIKKLEDFGLDEDVYRVFRQVAESVESLHRMESYIDREKLVLEMRGCVDFHRERLLDKGMNKELIVAQFKRGDDYISHIIIPKKHRVRGVYSQTLDDLELDDDVHRIVYNADKGIVRGYNHPNFSSEEKEFEIKRVIGIAKRDAGELYGEDTYTNVILQGQIKRAFGYLVGRGNYFLNFLAD